MKTLTKTLGHKKKSKNERSNKETSGSWPWAWHGVPGADSADIFSISSFLFINQDQIGFRGGYESTKFYSLSCVLLEHVSISVTSVSNNNRVCLKY